MTIHCQSFERFMDCVSGLVQRGLTFSANAESFTITLLGGY